MALRYTEMERENDSVKLRVQENDNPITYVYVVCAAVYYDGRCYDDFIWHRVGGPAYIREDGFIEWLFNNEVFYGVRDYCEACGFDDETTCYWVLKYGKMLPESEDQL